MGHHTKKPAAVAFLFDNSIFLIAGAVVALLWANLAPKGYHDFVHLDLLGGSHAEESHDESGAGGGETTQEGDEQDGDNDSAEEGSEGVDEAADDHGGGGHHGFTIHFLVNDILMAFFFAIAGKEVWEALLPGGPLSNPRKAATPLLATLGGIVGPAGVYIAGCMMTNTMDSYGDGWAIPCATDIAFSYLVARILFGPGHPAIAFLLLLAIADDAAGLIILAIFYPSGDLALEWLLLSALGVAIGFAMRKMKLHSFWWYLVVPGTLSWIGFLKSGIHPALGLVPIIPSLPHAATDLGLFAKNELNRDDTLNEFEHFLKDPVEIFLGLFGLVNAGVAFSSVGTGTYLVLAGLLIGKPVGITMMTWIAEKVFGLEVPRGMSYAHVVTLGMIAGIGFTVALFVSTAAFPPSKAPAEVLDSVKMGALGSFGAALLSFFIAKALGVKPTGALEEESDGETSDGEDAAGGGDSENEAASSDG